MLEGTVLRSDLLNLIFSEASWNVKFREEEKEICKCLRRYYLVNRRSMCSLLSLNVDFMPPPSIEIVLNQENVSMSKDDNHQYNCNCIYTDIYIIKIIPKKKHLLIDGILYSTFLFNGADIADNSREALNFKHATVRQCTSS